MKVLSVMGIRPEAIKMTPVVAELARHAEIVRVLRTTLRVSDAELPYGDYDYAN